MSELHTHQLLTDESGTESIEPEETISSDEAPHALPEKTFADFNVRADIVESLADAGITHPFPIQAMTLPVALGGHDIIGQAKTGTGKTLGFGIPALQRVIGRDDAGYDALPTPGAPQALVIVPTRELAVQVANDLQNAARKRNARIATIYGGRAYEPQVDALQKGVEVVVGTPGRLIDLFKQKHLVLKNVKMVILDEADEMLDLGFLPDVETLIAATPAVRQTLLFSATMPGPVIAMARRYMSQPTHIRAADPEDEGLTKRDIRQLIYRAHSMDKVEVVARILQARGRGRTIIFTKTKRTAAKVAEELRGSAAALPSTVTWPGAWRKQAQRFWQQQGGCPCRHRRRRPRHRRRRCHARDQLPVRRGREDLPAPRGPHRPRRQQGHRRDLRGLGRHAALGPDQQGPRPERSGTHRDLLLLPAPV